MYARVCRAKQRCWWKSNGVAPTGTLISRKLEKHRPICSFRPAFHYLWKRPDMGTYCWTLIKTKSSISQKRHRDLISTRLRSRLSLPGRAFSAALSDLVTTRHIYSERGAHRLRGEHYLRPRPHNVSFLVDVTIAADRNTVTTWPRICVHHFALIGGAIRGHSYAVVVGRRQAVWRVEGR